MELAPCAVLRHEIRFRWLRRARRRGVSRAHVVIACISSQRRRDAHGRALRVALFNSLSIRPLKYPAVPSKRVSATH